jgi:hypothetical protein
VLAVVALLALASCLEPTQIVIEARTNVDVRANGITTFTVGTPDETETAEPTTEIRGWQPDGFIGTLVVVPRSGRDATLSIKLVLGVEVETRKCKDQGYQGCIVARRRIRFSPHETLRLPMRLNQSCLGVACGESQTCEDGACVGADAPPADDEPADAAVERKPDAPPDAGGDVSLTPPIQIDCRTTTCTATHCCYDASSDIGHCGVEPCAPLALLRCDGSEDCGANKVCCIDPATGNAACAELSSCLGRAMCHDGIACRPPSQCTGTYDGYYRYCQ